MQVTRNHHQRYMARVTPFLILLYLAQTYLYQTLAPSPLSSDVTLILGVGLAALIALYYVYDHHHKIIFHPNYLEVKFDLLGIHQEILYNNITEVEVKKIKHQFAHICLHLRDGNQCHLHHIDSPYEVAEYITKKREIKLR
jgi:hypothetical protein